MSRRLRVSSAKSSRLTAPTSLSQPARTLFNEIVSACDPRHFTEAEEPLLVSYVQLVIKVRQCEAKLPIEQLERLLRTQALLATKLRLTPQTRIDKNVIRRWPNNQPSYLDKIT
jgi:hypothetical protein